MSINFYDFFLPFGGRLDGNNRWVKLAALIPWEQFEDEYAEQFSSTNGAGALPLRVTAPTALIRYNVTASKAQ